LLDHAGTGNDLACNPKPYTASGLAAVHAGADAARFFDVTWGTVASLALRRGATRGRLH
jgi:hypothetical protein